MITLATNEADQETNLRIAQIYPGVSACLGIHPCDVHETRNDFESLISPFLDDPNVAAIGETGSIIITRPRRDGAMKISTLASATSYDVISSSPARLG